LLMAFFAYNYCTKIFGFLVEVTTMLQELRPSREIVKVHLI